MRNLFHFRKIQTNEQGVSVVIGALMLTLIVVTAAVSFATFTAQKQEEIQKAEYQNTIKNLEKISITYFDFNESRVNITIHNDWTKSSTITAVQINHGWWKNDTQLREKQKLDTFNSETFNISYNELFFVDYNPVHNQPLILTIHTIYGNIFEKIFYPPNPVIKIQTESLPSASGDYYILDGSLSDHPGDGYIVSWNWNITNQSLPSTFEETVGRKAQISNTDFIHPNYYYWVNLTVVDNYGMKGKSSLSFSTGS